MLNYEFPPIGGGAGNAHLSLLRQYADNSDLRIDVLTSAPEPGFFTENFSKNITFYKVGLHKKNLHFWRKVEVIEWLLKARPCYRKLLRENDYDLVHAFFGFPTGWLCYKTADRLPYIISLRGSDVPGKHTRLKLDYKIFGPLLFKPIWKNAAGLVACSQGLRNRALKFLPSVSIDVIPNGIELDRFYPDKSDKRPDTTKLLTVGRLSITKRVQILVDAIRILHKDGCKVHFTIVGGGALEHQLKQIVKERCLADIIEVTGRIDAEKMPQVYRENDIFISASMQEGMSNAMLEAMASGLPIITTRCEGVEELIAGNGIIVEKPTPEDIAASIRQLIQDRQTYSSMSAASRKQAALFSWSSVASQYIRYYCEILKSRKGIRPRVLLSQDSNGGGTHKNICVE
jgi:glycosyltransferase involved in cell wall biosynthesis